MSSILDHLLLKCFPFLKIGYSLDIRGEVLLRVNIYDFPFSPVEIKLNSLFINFYYLSYGIFRKDLARFKPSSPLDQQDFLSILKAGNYRYVKRVYIKIPVFILLLLFFLIALNTL